MAELGAVFYRGPSMLTGGPIIGVLTGLEGGSANPKTGPMVQAWILRSDLAPMDAKRQNLDDAICGDCQLRGRDGQNSGCYVTPWGAPFVVYKQVIAGRYHEASWPELHALLEQRHLRLGAYGDPAAIPFEVWCQILKTAGGHVAYTHSWNVADPRFKTIAMASVETVDAFRLAHLAGWRTFRIRLADSPLLTLEHRAPGGQAITRTPLEFICPASDEAGFRTTCQACQLCRGTSSPARSVAIVVHGKPSNLKAFGIQAPFFKRREDAVSV